MRANLSRNEAAQECQFEPSAFVLLYLNSSGFTAKQQTIQKLVSQLQVFLQQGHLKPISSQSEEEFIQEKSYPILRLNEEDDGYFTAAKLLLMGKVDLGLKAFKTLQSNPQGSRRFTILKLKRMQYQIHCKIYDSLV